MRLKKQFCAQLNAILNFFVEVTSYIHFKPTLGPRFELSYILQRLVLVTSLSGTKNPVSLISGFEIVFSLNPLSGKKTPGNTIMIVATIIVEPYCRL